jgi:hypothetical protein
MSTRFTTAAASLLIITAVASVPAASQDPRGLTVRVIWEAGPPATELEPAERLAGDILQQAGIHTQWGACPPEADSDCHSRLITLRILKKPLAGTSSLSGATLGLSLVGTAARHAAVFWEEVERTSVIVNVPTHIVLGCAFAHEIGHLLLESRSHNLRGLMRPVLSAAEFRVATQGQLKFTRDEVITMQSNLRRAGTQSFALDRAAAPGKAMDRP